MATIRLNSGEQKEPPVNYTPSSDAVPQVKKSTGQKLKEAIFVSSLKDIKDWFVWDVVIPGAKNAFVNAIDILFFNGKLSGPRGGTRYYYGGGNTSYESYYQSQVRRRPVRQEEREYTYRSRRQYGSFDYRNIIGRNRMAAKEIVKRAREKILGQYKECTKADLYEIIEDVNNHIGYFAGVPEPTGIDRDWGWVNPDAISYCVDGDVFRLVIDDALFLPDLSDEV